MGLCHDCEVVIGPVVLNVLRQMVRILALQQRKFRMLGVDTLADKPIGCGWK